MSEFDEGFKELSDRFPWLKESLESLKETLKQRQKYNENLEFRISWLESFQLKQLRVIGMLLTKEQKDTDEYLDLVHLINQHIKRFNPESYEQHLSTYRALSEQSILKLGVHPEEEIEKLRKIFDLEDIPRIITFDFIKTHFGDEQLEIYKKILEQANLKEVLKQL